MIVMEFMECGSLADKLREQKPLPDNFVLKYLTQILEGGSFLHRREIFHSNIKPANILFTADDNLKISDFKKVVIDDIVSSPKRLQGADRSAANDIWGFGATVVHMLSGQPLNYLDNFMQPPINISQ